MPNRFTRALRRIFVTTTCSYCGEKLDPATEFRVLSFQAYCSEEHAVLDQQNNPL